MGTEAKQLMDLAPPEVDRLWAEAMEPAYQAQAALAETRRSIRRYRKWGRGDVPEYLTEREQKQEAALTEALQAGAPFDAEYKRRGGWTRYLIVVGSNGHVHRSYNGTDSPCHTLHPGRTLVSPVWALSGRNDAGVVAEMKATACSKCFPEAPVAARLTPEQEGFCAGSGRAVERFTGRYGYCQVCGAHVHGGAYGTARKHKAKGAR